jgi:hypothetical protein
VDIEVDQLNAPLPSADVIGASILPTNFATYLPSTYRFPGVTIEADFYDPTLQARALDVFAFNSNPTAVHTEFATEPDRAPFSGYLGLGCSGSPCFAMIGGNAVLLCTWTSPDEGPSLSYYADQIGTAMNLMATDEITHHPVTVDLSGYVAS